MVLLNLGSFAMAVGINLAAARVHYDADMVTAKAQQAWQNYSNTMVDLSNSLTQNSIVQNEVMSQQSFTEQAIDIKKDYLQTEATAEVSAAAAGVKGRSVNQALFDVQRTANIAEGRRQTALENAYASFDQQRMQANDQAARSKDYSYIPKPSFGTYALDAVSKAATSAAGSWF